MEGTPIACTLTASDLRDRLGAWLKLAPFRLSTTDIPGGVRIDFRPAPGLYDSLSTLIGLERECCPWMALTLEASAAAIRLVITAAGPEGEAAVRLTFWPLTSSLSRADGPPQTRPVAP